MRRVTLAALAALVFACGELPPEATPGPGEAGAQPTPEPTPTVDVYDFDCEPGLDVNRAIRSGVYFDSAKTYAVERDYVGTVYAGRYITRTQSTQRDAETGELWLLCQPASTGQTFTRLIVSGAS